jgi:GntR family transcriptional regulator
MARNIRGRPDLAVVPLERESRIAMHRQIASRLRKDIASGRYAPGDRIPTEPELSARYGVSRITARQAVEHLVREGLVSRKQGKGTFVQGPLVRHDLLDLRGILDELVEQGLSPQTELLSFGEVVPTARVAQMLGGRIRKAVHWRRLYRLNGMPFGLSTVHLDAGGVRIEREIADRLPTYEILRSVLAVKIARADVLIRYETGKAAVCRQMGLAPGTPLMALERVSFDAAGHACEHTLYHALASSYEFSVRVRGPIELVANLRQTG